MPPRKSGNKNAPAKKKEAALSTDVAMFHGDANAGMEGTTAESFAIPFLMILQKGSPQVDEASGVALPGAKAGMLFENIAQKMVDGKDGLEFVQCAYRRVYLRWNETKGFQGEYTPEDVAIMRQKGEVKEHKNKLFVVDKDGDFDVDESDYFVDTRNHYVIILDPKTGSWSNALISMGSTQIKKSRALMTALSSIKLNGPNGLFTPPTFANVIKSTTVPESNDKGNWFGWRFEIKGQLTAAQKPIYLAARKFHESVVKGEVEHRYEQEGVAGDESEAF